MKIDLYTKGVLTVIALCLLWLCGRETPLFSQAHAQGKQEKERPEVVIAGLKLSNGQIYTGELPIVITGVSIWENLDNPRKTVLPVTGNVRCVR